MLRSASRNISNPRLVAGASRRSFESSCASVKGLAGDPGTASTACRRTEPDRVCTATDAGMPAPAWSLSRASVPSLTRFCRSAKAMLRARRARIPISRGTRTDDLQKTLYWDDEAVPDTVDDVDEWLASGAQRFADAVFDPSEASG